MKKSEAAYLFGVSLSSVKRYARAWPLSSSTQGKDDRREEMIVVVFFYRAKLPPYSVKTRPWHIRVNRLPELLE
jgi:hypothetical protein